MTEPTRWTSDGRMEAWLDRTGLALEFRRTTRDGKPVWRCDSSPADFWGEPCGGDRLPWRGGLIAAVRDRVGGFNRVGAELAAIRHVLEDRDIEWLVTVERLGGGDYRASLTRIANAMERRVWYSATCRCVKDAIMALYERILA